MDTKGALLSGLVGNHEDLYRTSSSFRAAVENLRQTIPLWVDALAEVSRNHDARLEQLTKELEAGNFIPEGDVPLPIESQES